MNTGAFDCKKKKGPSRTHQMNESPLPAQPRQESPDPLWISARRCQNLQALTLLQTSKEQLFFRRNKLYRVDGWRKSRVSCLALQSRPVDRMSKGTPSTNQPLYAQVYTETSP